MLIYSQRRIRVDGMRQERDELLVPVRLVDTLNMRVTMRTNLFKRVANWYKLKVHFKTD
jgi:hypothetical protein